MHYDTAPKSQEKSLRARMLEALQNEIAFESFMDWIQKEFSSECLLSCIELVQFSECLVQFVEDRCRGDLTQIETLTSAHDLHLDILFFDQMPQSSIVYPDKGSASSLRTRSSTLNGNNDQARLEWDALIKMAGAFHTKYIRIRSELEINISGGLRNKWRLLDTTQYPEDEVLTLIAIVNDVVKEMMKYMQQSFNRFDTVSNSKHSAE